MNTSSIRFIKKSVVLNRTGLSNSGLYAKIQAGDFPQQIHIGERAVAWAEHEIDAWLQSRITARNA